MRFYFLGLLSKQVDKFEQASGLPKMGENSEQKGKEALALG